MRLGIFGGAFNPIHYGHLLLAETARDQLALDRVVFIPTGQPPHKSSRDLLPGPVRLELTRLAIHDQPAFVVSDVELGRGGVSYSIDTVRILRQQLPSAALFLLIGQDMLSVKWLGWQELKRLCTIVVAGRAGPPVTMAARPGSRDRRAGGAGPGTRRTRRDPKLKWLAMPQVEIASSDIRTRVRRGRSIRYLVPVAVERYIQQHQLYHGGGAG